MIVFIYRSVNRCESQIRRSSGQKIMYHNFPIWVFHTVFNYRSRALKNRGSYGKSALFLQRSQYISLDLYNVLKITQNDKSQCPRTDLNKRFLPRPKTITAWKLITHRSKISKNWNPPWRVPIHRFFKNWFLLIHKQLYSKYIQAHLT